MNEKFINREISWLSFNERVLQEAMDKSVPLIERFKFLGIFSNNLDEFFKIRVASVKRFLEINSQAYYDEPPAKVLTAIQKKVLELQHVFEETYIELIAELSKHDIHLINHERLNKNQIKFLKTYFFDSILPNLVPIILSKKAPLPHLRDKSIYLAIRAIHNETKDTDYLLIEIPTTETDRFIILPQEENKKFLILLEDVIKYFLPQVFSVFHYDKFESYVFKITRDAEMDIDNDYSKSILEKVTKSLKERKQGQPVRIVYDQRMPDDMLDFFLKKLGISEIDSIIPGGKYHNFKDFMKFPNLGDKSLEEPKINPIIHEDLVPGESMLDIIENKDIVLHYPYHDFTQFIALLREAAIDPNVSSIRTTIYRLAYDSKIVNVLINAAKNGKRVTVLIELQARFDEKSNIHWSQKLKDAGVKVIYGIPGLKVHSKITLIRRKKGNTRTRFAIIGTGNLHEGTAKVYTDVHLMTSDPEICEDVRNLFKFFEYNYLQFNYKKLIISPYNTRKAFEKLIDFEIDQAKENKKAEIHIKINNLVDRPLIEKLYEASQAGVKIKMMVRGMCAITPGIKNLSENIEIISIVDRFLEHSRIFYFYQAGKERIYISSADWMTRNLDARIEVTCPIRDTQLKNELKKVFSIVFSDNVKARIFEKELKNRYVDAKNQEAFRSQMEMYQYYLKKSGMNKTYIQRLFS